MFKQKYMPEGWKKIVNRAKTKEERIKTLKSNMKKESIMQGKVISCDKKGNLKVDLGNDLTGTIEFNEVTSNIDESGKIKKVEAKSKVKKVIIFKAIEVDDLGENIKLSRNVAQLEVRKWMYDNVKKDVELDCIIKNIQPFGVFADVGGGIVGFLPNDEIANRRYDLIKADFKVGNRLKLMVKQYDRDTGKIVLSYKNLYGGWDRGIAKFSEEQIVEGLVVRRDRNGIFVELAPDVVGLAQHRPGIEEGQTVNVYIKRIIPDKQRIKLIILG